MKIQDSKRKLDLGFLQKLFFKPKLSPFWYAISCVVRHKTLDSHWAAVGNSCVEDHCSRTSAPSRCHLRAGLIPVLTRIYSRGETLHPNVTSGPWTHTASRNLLAFAGPWTCWHLRIGLIPVLTRIVHFKPWRFLVPTGPATASSTSAALACP